ncbi:MAG: MBL fold metallo-hydrolase [Candidatus Hydrogenedentes bacterium]|nr:MBL fold metallo-hydrolase [Candidatus Hydrogenedentota bacterium]
MVDKVFENIHRIEVPLPRNPLKSVNCYVVKGADRDLVIDTGMNRPECRSAMESGLKELNVDLTRCDFFITHLHADHLGLASHLATEGSTVYFNRTEAKMVRMMKEKGGFGSRMTDFARLAGFSDAEMKDSLRNHPGQRFQAAHSVDFHLMDEGDTLEVGGYHFECIATPGHSPGHLCLYDADTKLMIAGDHVLGEITPNISAMARDENPLAEFLKSLDKVYEYDVDLALPGHRSLIKDFHGRIDELREHHRERLDEVMSVLDGKALPGYDVASRMTWKMKAATWEEVGIMQKWFATGEAIAHLHYLAEKGAVTAEEQDGVTLYSSA